MSLGKPRTIVGSNFACGTCLGKDSKTNYFSRIITLLACSFLLTTALPLNVMADVSGSISTNSENYVVGDTISITVEFFDENGDATDPSYFEVNIIIASTDSLETRITKSAFSRSGEGSYQKTLKAQKPTGLRSASVFPCNTILGFCQPLDDTSYRIEDVPPPNFTLTVKKSGNGSGTVTGQGVNCGSTCSAAYMSGTLVTLTPTPSQGSTFGGWSGCDSVAGNKCSVRMNSNRTITANFNPTPQTFKLTVTKQGNGSGTVTGNGIACGADCSESYQKGTSVMLTATSMSGSTFGSWSGCDSVSGSTCTVAVNSNRTVNVRFLSQNLPDLTISNVKCGVSFAFSGALLCSITIQNIGSAPASNFYVSVTVGKQGWDVKVDVLQQGQTTKARLYWESYCHDVGTNVSSLVITVDLDNAIKESDEKNNLVSTDIEKCANLPELQGRILVLSPENPKNGDTVTFTVTVQNLGTKPAGAFKVVLHIGAEQLSMQVKSLAVNESTGVKFQWVAKCGSYKVVSNVDTENRVKERNENNNESVTINVEVDCRETKFLADVVKDDRFLDAEFWQVQVTKVIDGENVTGKIEVLTRAEGCAESANIADNLGSDSKVEIFGRLEDDGNVETCSSNKYYLKLLSNPNQPPVADFEMSPAKLLTGQSVKFKDKSKDPDGSIKSREWTFGDRAFSSNTQKDPSFTYTQAGNFSACLDVRDNRTTRSFNTCKTVEVLDNGGVIKIRGTVTKKQTQFDFQLYWVKVSEVLESGGAAPAIGTEVFIRIVTPEQQRCVPQHSDLPPTNAKVEVKGEYISTHDPQGQTVPGIEVCEKDYYLRGVTLAIPPRLVDVRITDVPDGNASKNQVVPFSSAPGSSVKLWYKINNTDSTIVRVGLGASIRLPTKDWINDISNDRVIDVSPGSNWYSRRFNIPSYAQFGTYSVAFGLWDGQPGSSNNFADPTVKPSWLDVTPKVAQCYKISLLGLKNKSDIKVQIGRNIPSAWISTLVNAMNSWNGVGANMEFHLAAFSEKSPDVIIVRESLGGNDDGIHAVAHTDWLSTPVKIAFNSKAKFLVSTDVGNPAYDLYTVAAHELGHVIGLDDISLNDMLASNCLGHNNPLMFAGIDNQGNSRPIGPDDIVGARAIHGNRLPPKSAAPILFIPKLEHLMTNETRVGLQAITRFIVYNLKGQQVFTGAGLSSIQDWAIMAENEDKIANGIYLYVLVVRQDTAIVTRVGKLVLIR